MIRTSTLFIVNDIETSLNEMISTLPKHSVRIIKNQEEGKNEFQLLHAKKAIKESYIADNKMKYIFLCGDNFRVEAQNSLLKVLEEPPKNIIFILVTISKSSILPTILSRLQVIYNRRKKIIEEFSLNIQKLELKDIYKYLKENQRISKSEAKNVLESILYSIHKQNMKLTQKELHSFSTAMKLLELNSRPLNVLTTVLLNIMVKR
jgi:DNA polymerase III subunit delta'